MRNDRAVLDALNQRSRLLRREADGLADSIRIDVFIKFRGQLCAVSEVEGLRRRERTRDLFLRRQRAVVRRGVVCRSIAEQVGSRVIAAKILFDQQLDENLEVVDLLFPLVLAHLEHVAVHDLDHRAQERALIQRAEQHHAVVVIRLVRVPDLGHGGILVDAAAVAVEAHVAALKAGDGAVREGLGLVAHNKLDLMLPVHAIQVHRLGQERCQMDEVHLQHGIGRLGHIVIVTDVEIAVVDLHGADRSREAVGIDVEGVLGRVLIGVVDRVIPLIVLRVADDRLPAPGAAVGGRGAGGQRALEDRIARIALGLLQRIGVDRGVNALFRVQRGVQRLLAGIDRHIQLAVVLDHLVDRAAVVGVIHMVGGVVEELFALLRDLGKLGVAQRNVVLDALEAAVGIEVVRIGRIGDDVRAVLLRNRGDQRALIHSDRAGNGKNMSLLHGAVLVHVHRLIDGTEGIVLRVDLKDGGNAGRSVRHALRADLRADKVEAAVVRNRVAQRDLIAVDRTGHDDLALAGLDVHLEEDSLRGHGMLGVIVVAVEQTHCIVDQLLVVFHSLLIGGAVLIRLLLQKAERLEHRLGIVLGDAGTAVHRADVDPVAIAQRGEGVGLAGVAGQARLDLREHAVDLLGIRIGILGHKLFSQLCKLRVRIGHGRIRAGDIHVLNHAGAYFPLRVGVLVVVHKAVALPGGNIRVGNLFQRVAVVCVFVLCIQRCVIVALLCKRRHIQ